MPHQAWAGLPLTERVQEANEPRPEARVEPGGTGAEEDNINQSRFTEPSLGIGLGRALEIQDKWASVSTLEELMVLQGAQIQSDNWGFMDFIVWGRTGWKSTVLFLQL